MGSVLKSGRSPGGGHGNPLQYSCLESPVFLLNTGINTDLKIPVFLPGEFLGQTRLAGYSP